MLIGILSLLSGCSAFLAPSPAAATAGRLRTAATAGRRASANIARGRIGPQGVQCGADPISTTPSSDDPARITPAPCHGREVRASRAQGAGSGIDVSSLLQGIPGDGGVRTSVSFLYERVVCERNRDPSKTTTPAGGLSL